ncbi:hypothetical protein BG841_03620 [Marinobacter sp. X15-166B]|nr:hypothetical protein BG841_03620 [Marinobacter sp. X15-166B]
MNGDDKDEMVDIQRMLVIEARERLYLQQYNYVRDDARKMLSRLSLPPEGTDDPRLLRGLLEADVDAEKHHLGLMLAGTLEGDKYLQSLKESRPHLRQQPEPLPTTRSTKELVDEYLAYKAREVSDKSLRDYKTSYDVLIELLNDRPLGDLKRHDAVELRDELLDYPVNRKKGKNSQLSLEQIKSQETWQTISSSTANKHYTRWAILAGWAVQWDYIPKNYLEGLAPEPDETSRRAWNNEELNSIFNLISNRKVDPDTLWSFWLPLLGLVTGARLGELCGLLVSDVTQTESGTWYLNFENNEHRHLKNKQSRRMTPLHPGLIPLGFLEFVENQNSGLLFPSLASYSSEALSHEPSKWFGRFKSGLEYGKDVNFHSFRHLMRNMLSDVEAQDSHIKGILGHEQGDVTFGGYGDRLKPDLLAKHIEALPVAQYLKQQPHYTETLK